MNIPRSAFPVLIFAALLIAAAPVLAVPAVNVTMGAADDLTVTRVATPNIELPPMKKAVPGAVGKGSPTPPAADPATPLEDLKLVFPHVFGRPVGVSSSSNPRRKPMDEVLLTAAAPPAGTASGPLEIKGPGSGERIARTDGEATIQPLLSTYSPASYVVRLIDVNGQEITFDGKPLFIWTRPDDKKRSPCEFEGKAVAGSMKPNGTTADWSPVAGLKFRVQLKAGQRLKVETRGRPEPSSHLTLQSATF